MTGQTKKNNIYTGQVVQN